MAKDSLVIELPVELLNPAESRHYEGDVELPAFKAGCDLYSFSEPLVWQVDISNTGEGILVLGTVEGLGTTTCGRCLDAAEVDFLGEVEGYFLFVEPTQEEAEEDDFDYEVLAEDKKIDLEPLIMAALLLDAPYTPLCQDECKGICPTCGANLNSEQCTCLAPQQENKNPFAVLKNYDFGEHQTDDPK